MRQPTCAWNAAGKGERAGRIGRLRGRESACRTPHAVCWAPHGATHCADVQGNISLKSSVLRHIDVWALLKYAWRVLKCAEQVESPIHLEPRLSQKKLLLL